MKTLWDIPLSARNDPHTSFVAAEELAASGKYGRQKAAVLAMLKRWNGSTSAELARRMGVDRYLTARRLPDLEREGLAVQGPARRCTVTGRACVTWFMKETFGPKEQ